MYILSSRKIQNVCYVKNQSWSNINHNLFNNNNQSSLSREVEEDLERFDLFLKTLLILDITLQTLNKILPCNCIQVVLFHHFISALWVAFGHPAPPFIVFETESGRKILITTLVGIFSEDQSVAPSV
jgi:hypothetical protein